MDNSREDLPRVSIDSTKDWEIIKASYRKTMLSQLEAELSAQGLLQEAGALSKHVDQFVEQTFGFAELNLRVNGNNFNAIVDEQEPFDEALDRRIWSLADTRLQWHKRIAEIRRNIPLEMEEVVTSSLLSPPPDVAEVAGIPQLPEEDAGVAEIDESMAKTSAISNELEQTVNEQLHRSSTVLEVGAEIKALKP